jgi:hypothetical protein
MFWAHMPLRWSVRCNACCSEQSGSRPERGASKCCEQRVQARYGIMRQPSG